MPNSNNNTSARFDKNGTHVKAQLRIAYTIVTGGYTERSQHIYGTLKFLVERGVAASDIYIFEDNLSDRRIPSAVHNVLNGQARYNGGAANFNFQHEYCKEDRQ